jgi:thiamine pyrophosphokinase
MTIDYLSNRPEYIETVASWIFTEFVISTPRTAPYEKILRNFSNTHRSELPVTLVAIEDGECIGTVSVFMNDFKTQSQLTPWLAALYVVPEYRGRGVAKNLIGHVYFIAKQLKYRCLYLRTEHASGYYERLGWSFVCRATDEYGIETDVYKYLIPDEDWESAMKGICYIIGAGIVDECTIEPTELDFVIAADAGYDHLSKLSVVADLVVGDFDSLGKRPNHTNIVEHPAEKDETDMMLAIDEGLHRGYKTFVILGGLGGRLDHTFANIQALTYLSTKNARGYLLGDGQVVTVIKNGAIRFDGEKRGVISVFCTGDTASGVDLKGLKYPLSNATLSCCIPLGVSNEFIGEKSEISVRDGALIVMWHDNACEVIDNISVFDVNYQKR